MGKSPRQLRTATLSASISLALVVSVAAAPRDSSTIKRIFVLGDSLSAGFGLKSSQAWPAIVTEKLRETGLTSFEITNASQTGGTTAGGVERLPPHLKRKIDIFVLELGINDAFRGVPIEQIRSNLQSIIDQVRSRQPNASIVIAGMQLPNVASDDYVGAFGGIFRAVAEKNRATLIPYFLEGVGGDPDLNQWDRVHPNAAGQRVLAENVWHFLEPLLRKAAAGVPAHVD
jgi:acyl-CoA thioesterase-1